MVLTFSSIFFLSWHAAKSFIKYVTLESFIPTSMLSINKKTMWLGVTSIASEVPNICVDTGSWRHLPRHLVRFSHAYPARERAIPQQGKEFPKNFCPKTANFGPKQGGRTWQPFVGSKIGNENFRQTRIYNFRVKCIVFVRNRKFSKSTQ